MTELAIGTVSSRSGIVAAMLFAWVLMPAVGFAGQGWYLLRPPLAENFPKGCVEGTSPSLRYCSRNSVNLGAALAEWDQAGAFDTVAECERFNSKARSGELDRGSEPPNALFGAIYVVQRNEGRCVSSDDPRLGVRIK